MAEQKKNDITPDFNKFMDILDSIINYCEVNNVSTKISLPVEKYLKSNGRKCTLGKESIYINSYGDVYPCAFSEGGLCWGNILEKSLEDILKNNWKHENDICRACPINRYKEYKAKTI